MNCIIIDDEEMSRNVVQHFVQQTEYLNLVGVYPNAVEAISFLSKNTVDLIFLDVEMPGMSGYDLINSLSSPPPVILITGKKDYAAEAFDYNIIDYLLKPLSYPRFLKAVSKLKNQQAPIPTIGGKEIFVRSDSKIVKIKLDDICYIEALADYIMIFTSNNKYIIHSTMKGINERLPQEQFIRVHRSYIININKIETIENLIIVINNKHIPIGALYKESFMKRLNLY